jgi:Holliday junction DNA helicase RuvB
MQVSGPVDVEEARSVMSHMLDGDILFWDEFHQAVTGNRNRADWTLPFLTDGELQTANGVQKMPNITVVAATTDVGKLPLTVISRFMVRPKLEAYTDAEAVQIVNNLSDRMNIPITPAEAPLIARAANNNPRDMRMILTAVRDVAYAGEYSLEKAFRWAGLTYDGIPQVAQDIMLVLLAAKDHTASLESIQAQLSEPGPIRHHEQVLLQKGYVTVTGRGRMLTDDGIARAEELIA